MSENIKYIRKQKKDTQKHYYSFRMLRRGYMCWENYRIRRVRQSPSLVRETAVPMGKNMAYEYARVLTKAGVQVISGLARGVDAAAMQEHWQRVEKRMA